MKLDWSREIGVEGEGNTGARWSLRGHFSHTACCLPSAFQCLFQKNVKSPSSLTREWMGCRGRVDQKYLASLEK